MLSCKDIARKTMSERPFTFKEKIEYRLHLFICATCRVYLKQMENFEHSLKSVIQKKSLVGDGKDGESFEVAEKLKQEIIERVLKQK